MRQNSYQVLISSCNRPVIFSLLSSEVLAFKIENLFAAAKTSSLFGTIIAPRRR